MIMRGHGHETLLELYTRNMVVNRRGTKHKDLGDILKIELTYMRAGRKDRRLKYRT